MFFTIDLSWKSDAACMIWSIVFQKCVLLNSTCWWRYNRPMWKKVAFVPWPSGNMCGKFHGKRKLRWWFEAFCSKTEQSCKLWKLILANQDGIWNIRRIGLDHMTIEILCTDLRDFCIKSQGVISKNVFYISWTKGGAIKGWCEKCRAKVYP